MEIRRAAPKDDPEAIGELYAQSWKSAYRGIVPDEYLDSLSGKRWSSFISSSDFEAYVLLLGGAYAGTASVCPGRDEKKPGWGEIVSIYLLPEHFGKGCGKPLLAAALDTGEKQPAPPMVKMKRPPAPKPEPIGKRYVCGGCGYEYIPELGDEDAEIAPGTLFENLPEDWVCPECAEGKDQFIEA